MKKIEGRKSRETYPLRCKWFNHALCKFTLQFEKPPQIPQRYIHK
jgi:hypothetical protein